MRQLILLLGKDCAWIKAKWKSRRGHYFLTVTVGGEVTGVGYGCGPVGVEAEDEAGSPDGAVKRGLLHLAGKPLGVPVGDYWVK